MPLSDEQIERYSRQIIVPEMGARAQERLLGARMLLCGESRDASPVLLYLAGAGVGQIALMLAGPGEKSSKFASSVAALNPDCSVSSYRRGSAAQIDLALMLISSEASADAARAVLDELPRVPAIIVRLDSPAKIGIFPAPPPCPRCDPILLSPAINPSDFAADPIAISAASEALKLLAGIGGARPTIIEFDGYESRSHDAAANPQCRCATAERPAKAERSR